MKNESEKKRDIDNRHPFDSDVHVHGVSSDCLLRIFYGPKMNYLQIVTCLQKTGIRVPSIVPPWGGRYGTGGGGVGGLSGSWSALSSSYEELYLENGDIDIMDCPLTTYPYIDTWVDQGRVPSEITLSPYREIAKSEFALNNQQWPTGCDGRWPHTRQLPDPPGEAGDPPESSPNADWDPETKTWKVYYDPDCSACQTAREFRKALAHLTNKDHYVSSICTGDVERIDTMVPHVLGGEAVYGDLEAMGLIYNYDVDTAKQILDNAGFTIGDDGVRRIDPRKDPAGNNYLDPLIFYVPTHHHCLGVAGHDKMIPQMKAVGIEVNEKRGLMEWCYQEIWDGCDYHIFATGWDSHYTDVDYIYDQYHSSRYWAPIEGYPNYPGFCNLEFDEQAEKIKYGTSMEEVRNATLEAQKIYANQSAVIDLWSPASAKAYRTGWEDAVNVVAGTGVDNYFSFLNMYKQNEDRIKWGFSYSLVSLSVISTITCERKILGLIYDSLIHQNPYDVSEDHGLLAESWSTGTWDQGKYVTFTLRDNVKWHDGSALTPEDVKFSIELIKACRWWAWEGGRLKDLHNVTIREDNPNLDSNQVRVYFNQSSVWIVHLAGFIPIINKKIWMAANDEYGWGYGTGSFDPSEVKCYYPWDQDIYDNSTGGVGQDGIVDLAQDGTGPWKFVGVGDGVVDLTANREFYRSQSEISEYIETCFHKCGNVNYPFSVHKAEYEARQIGTDRVIDEPDIILMTRAYLSTTEDPHGIDWDEYNVDADINEDGTVDDIDIAIASFFYGRSAGGSALPSFLKLPAQDQYNNTLTSDVYIDSGLVGNTSSMGFMVQMGTHEVFVNDFWESGTTGYRYGFDHWKDGSMDNPRNITVISNKTKTVCFDKKWCPGDVNCDGIVDIVDIVTVSVAIGSQRDIGDPWPPSGNWDSRADLNCDETIDTVDVNIVAANFGNTY